MTIQQLAQELLEALRPGCERIEIAGSIRRRKAEPKDIELVAIPRILLNETRDIFGQVYSSHAENDLENSLEVLIAIYGWEYDRALPRNGPKYKRLRHIASGACCDLFIVAPETWGAQLVIRTGPADFSHMLVTRALRLGMKQENGRLLRIHRDSSTNVIETPEEIDYLKALGLPWIEPKDRNADRFKSY